jgi:hypothetical protein
MQNGKAAPACSLGVRLRYLVAHVLRYLRHWLAQLRHPVRCLQALLGLWNRLFGRTKPHRLQGIPQTCEPEPVRPMTISATRVPDSAFVQDTHMLTVSSAMGSSAGNASSSTFSDDDHHAHPSATPHTVHNPRASYHDIPRRNSPAPSYTNLANISTPNLPHMHHRRSNASMTFRPHARPASRISGRPISINRSSVALTLVRPDHIQ